MIATGGHSFHTLFPAHAGVFPATSCSQTHQATLPRARGGISKLQRAIGDALGSSPRTRGYFRSRRHHVATERLFPAHAGVFPGASSHMTVMDTLPRARGGISTRSASCSRTLSSSPRTRGYFRSHLPAGAPCMLFPAHAGVFPESSFTTGGAMALPRARGGISGSREPSSVKPSSSPRTRGYFRGRVSIRFRRRLFPAHAGVFPQTESSDRRERTLPRARGGISNTCQPARNIPRSSPRTRGYFPVSEAHISPRHLFPAHAGVFPVCAARLAALSALPRARGGISSRRGRKMANPDSSPRTRGYFHHRERRFRPAQLFPAHAGVFPGPGSRRV